MLSKRGTELLCEVHEHFSMQKNLAERGFWVYDFALPMLTLQVQTPPLWHLATPAWGRYCGWPRWPATPSPYGVV